MPGRRVSAFATVVVVMLYCAPGVISNAAASSELDTSTWVETQIGTEEISVKHPAGWYQSSARELDRSSEDLPHGYKSLLLFMDDERVGQ